MTPQNILSFWFKEIDKKFWFTKNETFDQQIRDRFENTFVGALKGLTAEWRNSAEGRLAEIIVLDQFSRNMYRGTAKSFSGDSLALKLAEEAVQLGEDQKLTTEQRSFMYMPYMHSEDPEIHEKAMKIFSQPGMEENLRYEILHKNIIDRFGRYPHRNEILGRSCTVEEIDFLKQPGSGF